MRLKIEKRESQKCTFNRKEALFTPCEVLPFGPTPPEERRVRVEHVHVNEGGQAVIGNLKTAGK